MNYREIEDYINSIPRFSKIKSQGNCQAILERFGNPQDSFHYIHIAGTNGKGSVSAYLDACLRLAGKRCGLFTSPHLITTTERMKVNGVDISEEAFCQIFDDLMAVVREREGEGAPHPTYFEFLYLMAMIWFGREKIEYGIIETGLGGRLDATNLIRKPVLTIITSISFDHMEILGDTIEKIAAEKAGIIKEGVPVICDGSVPEAAQIIRKTAEEKGAPCTILWPEMVHDVRLTDADRHDQGQIKTALNHGKNIDFLLEDSYHKLYNVHLCTSAVYQTANSSLALLGMKNLQMQDQLLAQVSDETILSGLYGMHWPGRLEELLPDIYVDGAHNVGGVERLVESLALGFADRALWLVFAVASDKNFVEMAERLISLQNLRGVIVTEIENSRRTDLHKVAKVFSERFEGYVGQCQRVTDAIALGAEKAKEDEGILVCAGSLYLAGSVIEALGGKHDQF